MDQNPGSERGAALAAAVAALLVALTLTPLMVLYAQRESVWTAKQSHSTRAFHLAESGIEKGFMALSLSPEAWTDMLNGIPLAGYHFDKEYVDVPGGGYSISITSGPGVQQATIISVGRDALRRETRA